MNVRHSELYTQYPEFTAILVIGIDTIATVVTPLPVGLIVSCQGESNGT